MTGTSWLRTFHLRGDAALRLVLAIDGSRAIFGRLPFVNSSEAQLTSEINMIADSGACPARGAAPSLR
jgi:hypothetical protein